MSRPAPAPQPVIPTTPAAGTVYASASSVPPVSGVSGVGFFNGPWTIITQTLDIDYNRVPSVQVSATDLDLDSASIDHAITDTEIAAVFTAAVTIVSSSDYYPTSSVYQQPQTFEIYPVSADHLGNTYGPLNASCMGPMGSIKTKMPFILRKPREDSDDANYPLGTHAIRASNFQYATTSLEGTFSQQLDQLGGLTDFESWAGPKDGQGSFHFDFDQRSYYSTPVDSYRLTGGYSTSGEFIQGVYNFITSVGESIRDVKVENTPSTRTFGLGPWGEVLQFTGIPEYDPNRHDYGS